MWCAEVAQHVSVLWPLNCGKALLVPGICCWYEQDSHDSRYNSTVTAMYSVEFSGVLCEQFDKLNEKWREKCSDHNYSVLM